MALVSYNGVVLPYATLSNFDQNAVYDPSHTDHILNKFSVSIQTIINVEYLTLLAPDLVVNSAPGTTNPADIANVIRDRLLVPRRKLSVQVNGVDLIPAPQSENSGFVDAKNGPQPQGCRFFQLTSSTFLFSYSIEAHYWSYNQVSAGKSPTVTANLAGSSVLSNRWTETVDIDNLNYSTKTRNGVFIIRSDNTNGFIADQLRSQMAVVSIPQGFIRQKSKYTVSPDGLSLSYETTDKEVFLMPPSPAFEADGEFIVTGTKLGSYRFGECHIHLKGQKTTPKPTLVKLAVGIALSKCAFNSNVAGANADFQIQEAVVRTPLYKNEASVRLRVMYIPQNEGVKGIDRFGNVFIAAIANMKTDTPLSVPNSKIAPPVNDRGSASLLLRAAAYYDPSLASEKLQAVPGFANVGQATLSNPVTDRTAGKVQTVGKQVGEVGSTGENLTTNT